MRQSLVALVADIVAQRGTVTLDEMELMLPEYTRAQVQKALQNAQARGMARCAIPGKGGPGRRASSVWAPPLPKQPARDREISCRPPNSAWELSHSRQLLGEWPPAFPGARQYIPLGPWTEPNPPEGASA
jgi:hypothetical protein